MIEPFLVKDKLTERMKSVSEHRERLRAAQRESFARKTGTLRAASAQGVLRQLVENLKLLEAFDAEEARKQLMMAGYRGQRPVFIFMAARIGMPFVSAFAAGIYVYVLQGVELDRFGKLCAVIMAFFAGFYIPNFHIKNAVQKRQQKVQLAWPDALDLLLICVEAGMSIEVALQKVSQEVGGTSPELAEELGLTVPQKAEFAFILKKRLTQFARLLAG